jgi:acetyl-CoA acetyltransferase
LTLAEYMSAPMLADPLCRLDFCLETDGALAFIVTSAERARDLRQRPVYIAASAHGGEREWGRAFFALNMPDRWFTTAGGAHTARRLYAAAGIEPKDIDVALLYDHFSPLVIMQLEDDGFCKRGEGGPFVESGAIRINGAIPVNPHGGHLSEAYVIGMTHIREAVEQLRGTAINQVPGARYALVTGGPAPIPMSGAILRN